MNIWYIYMYTYIAIMMYDLVVYQRYDFEHVWSCRLWRLLLVRLRTARTVLVLYELVYKLIPRIIHTFQKRFFDGIWKYFFRLMFRTISISTTISVIECTKNDINVDFVTKSLLKTISIISSFIIMESCVCVYVYLYHIHDDCITNRVQQFLYESK